MEFLSFTFTFLSSNFLEKSQCEESKPLYKLPSSESLSLIQDDNKYGKNKEYCMIYVLSMACYLVHCSKGFEI